MTIVRSLGVTTLVALMSAHRAVMQQREADARPFDQAAVQAIEDYLLQSADRRGRSFSEKPQ